MNPVRQAFDLLQPISDLLSYKVALEPRLRTVRSTCSDAVSGPGQGRYRFQSFRPCPGRSARGSSRILIFQNRRPGRELLAETVHMWCQMTSRYMYLTLLLRKIHDFGWMLCSSEFNVDEVQPWRARGTFSLPISMGSIRAAPVLSLNLETRPDPDGPQSLSCST